MRRLRNWLVPDWYQTFLFLIGLFFVGLLFWFQLGTLVPGLSEAELAQTNAVTSFHDIRVDPLNFPYKLLQLGFTKLDVPTPAVRLASACIGLVVLGCFFYILRHWYTRRVAILGSVLFACSAWLLHIARSGTMGIMLALLIATIAAAIWLQRSRSSKPAVAATALLLVTLLYMPGAIWFVLPLIIWQFERVSRFLHAHNLALVVLMVLTSLALLAPLVLALYEQPSLIKSYFGLPATLPSPVEALKNIARVPMQLFFRGPNDPTLWLGRLALLSWFETLMFAIGLYALWTMRSLDRTKLIGYVFVVGTLLIALKGPVTISLLMPFVYLICASGIALMLQQWLTIFPRNPVARTFGPTLMTVAVLMAAFYSVNHYFIAWPNAPETKLVFRNQIDNIK